MRFKIPKNDERFVWTNHSVDKMKQYQLSEQRIKSVLNTPKRKEEGVAPNTEAVMQSTGSVKHPTEIWVMYQNISPNSKDKSQKEKSKFIIFINKRIRIISVWRYPGISLIRTVPNIPEEAWNALDGKDDIK